MSEEKTINSENEDDYGKRMIDRSEQLTSDIAKCLEGRSGAEICLAICVIGKFLIKQYPETLNISADFIGVKIGMAEVASE